MNYEKTKLTSELTILRSKIQEYKAKPGHNENYLLWMEKLLGSIEQYMTAVDKQISQERSLRDKYINDQLNVIKKQALIIDISGIQYPTINQTLSHIYDIYLAKHGRTEDLFNPEKVITVTIPIV